MLYGLLALALILSLPACGMLRKSDQGCTDGSCGQTAETMPAMEEEVAVSETVVPDDEGASEMAGSEMPSEEMPEEQK